MNVFEQFHAVPMAANSSYTLTAPRLGGFIATVSGTLTIQSPTKPDGTAGTILLNAVPVTAGVFLPLPFVFNHPNGVVVTLAGGAAGTLAV